MRLYDQSSSTPIKADDKKWMRPINFLPNQRETKEIKKQNTPSSNKRSVLSEMTANTKCGSVTTESTGIEISKLYKHHTIYDDFRFDIDDEQELSTKSLSTLSTHSTLRYFTQDACGGYRKDITKPISIAKIIAFENSSRFSKASSITASLWERHTSAADENAPYIMSKGNGDKSDLIEDYLTPQLTLSTQSSEESDSMWVEFNRLESQSPFSATNDGLQFKDLDDNFTRFSNKLQPLHLLCCKKPCNEGTARKIQKNACRNNQRKTTSKSSNGNYTKYHEMLLDGASVTNLLQTMKNDQVDPSIISLVLAASKSNQTLRNVDSKNIL